MTNPGRHYGLKTEDIDARVDEHINETIERLQEHVVPSLASYEEFIKIELNWIKREKEIRQGLKRQLP